MGDVDLSFYVFLDKFSRESCSVLFADDKGFLRKLLENMLKFPRKCFAVVFEKKAAFDSEILNVLAESFGVSETAYNVC
jgi:hypothetical protein